jgi:hypothetical protein
VLTAVRRLVLGQRKYRIERNELHNANRTDRDPVLSLKHLNAGSPEPYDSTYNVANPGSIVNHNQIIDNAVS